MNNKSRFYKNSFATACKTACKQRILLIITYGSIPVRNFMRFPGREFLYRLGGLIDFQDIDSEGFFNKGDDGVDVFGGEFSTQVL